jgi:hypothetical protein
MSKKGGFLNRSGHFITYALEGFFTNSSQLIYFGSGGVSLNLRALDGLL